MENNGLSLLAKLQSFDALHIGPKCNRGHVMQLTHNESKLQMDMCKKNKLNYW